MHFLSDNCVILIFLKKVPKNQLTSTVRQPSTSIIASRLLYDNSFNSLQRFYLEIANNDRRQIGDKFYFLSEPAFLSFWNSTAFSQLTEKGLRWFYTSIVCLIIFCSVYCYLWFNTTFYNRLNQLSVILLLKFEHLLHFNN